MFYIILALVIFLITNGIVLLEEELLIIIASFVWVDAAGKLIKNFLVNELEHKSVVLKNKYIWFLKRKLKLDDLVIRGYYKRIYRFLRTHREVAQYLLPKLVSKNVLYVSKNILILEQFEIHTLLNNIGITLVKENLAVELEQLMVVLLENKMYINNYTTFTYVNKEIGNIPNTISLHI